MWNFSKNVVLFLWQLPQNLLGLLLIKLYKPERKHVLDNGVQIHYSTKMRGGISLGKYCIVNTMHYRKILEESLKRSTVKHEAIGHTKQSRMFGWLYLLVIGIPSLLWVFIHRIKWVNKKVPYSWFYTEKWADKLSKT